MVLGLREDAKTVTRVVSRSVGDIPSPKHSSVDGGSAADPKCHASLHAPRGPLSDPVLRAATPYVPPCVPHGKLRPDVSEQRDYRLVVMAHDAVAFAAVMHDDASWSRAHACSEQLGRLPPCP